MTTGRLASYDLHGYLLETDLPLPGCSPATSRRARSEDELLRLVRGTPVPPADPPSGAAVLAELADPARRQVYRFTRSGDRLVLRFSGAADIAADAGLRRAVARPWPGADPGVLAVLVPGSVMAARLIIDGHLVLHAGAFAVDGSAVAVVGGSGMGKSTLGALAVLAGHRLVSDDVLRVDLTGSGASVWPGSAESRLRRSALDLVSGFADIGTVRPTADGRTAVAGPSHAAPGESAGTAPLPLRCCVVPRPCREATEVSVRRLDGFTALRQLSAFPRVVGWCDPETSAQQFHLLADLCERVPVVQATLPWGPPFDTGIVQRLVAGLDRL